MKTNSLLYVWAMFMVLLLPLSLAAQERGNQGRISGVVSNQATGSLLRDASVEIPVLSRTLLTDELGRFYFDGIPFGTYEIVVSYMDLNTDRRTVTLSATEPSVSLDFPLNADVYVLEAFKVSSQQEGTAAALMRQKTSDNVRNVVSLDAMGLLTNENPGELLAQLPGIAGVVDDSGDVTTINIRGIDSSMNTVNYDGAQMATSYGPTSRAFRFLNINASTFEELEVIKALTPNVSASSLGGMVNMKTKSTLNMKERLMFEYRFSLSIAPPFFDYNPRRADHRTGPLYSFDYRQVFDAFGGRRNLGVSLNLFHRKKIEGYARTIQDYESTESNDTTYMTSYQATDMATNKINDSAMIRFDYKLSERSRFYLKGSYSQQRNRDKPGMESISVRYASNYTGIANNKVPEVNTATSNASYTEITNGTFQITQGGIGFFDAQYQAQFGGEHLLDRVSIDYDLSYSESDVHLDGNKGDPYAGMQIMLRKIDGIAGSIDRTQGDDYPIFTQMSGPSVYDLNTYLSEAMLIHRTGTRSGKNYEGKLNAKTHLSVHRIPIELSSGLAFRRQETGEENITNRYRFDSTKGIAALSTFLTDIELDPRFGSTITSVPLLDLLSVSRDFYANSGNWTRTHQDYTYHYREKYGETRQLREDIYALYFMGKARVGKLNILGGVRVEHTASEADGWERIGVAQQSGYYNANKELGMTPDEVQEYRRQTALNRVNAEYKKFHVKKDYTDWFPSLHFTYSFRKDLLARASWSTGIGRPPPRQLIPGISVDEDNRTVYKTNPDLVCQYGHSFDLALEYYLPRAGLFSAGVFRKEISDFIYRSRGTIGGGMNNGFDGQYTSFELQTYFNGSKAIINGLELSYNQLLTFLPKPLDRIRVIISYTLLSTKGDYGDNATSLSTKEVQGFIPEVFNARLQYGYKRFYCSLSASWMSDYIRTYSPDVNDSIFREARTHVTVTASWKFTEWLKLDVSVGNIFNKPYVDYRGVGDRRQQTNYNGQTCSIGLSGRF